MARKARYLRIPFGILFFALSLYLTACPLRRRYQQALHDASEGGRPAPSSWLSLDTLMLCSGFQWFVMYTFAALTFLNGLYLGTNVHGVLFPGPRRLSLSNDYFTGEPPMVSKVEAFKYDTPPTLYEWVKMIGFLLSGVLVLRIVLFTVMLWLAMATMSVAGQRDRRSSPKWFSFWTHLSTFFGHVVLMTTGIYHVKLFGEFASREDCKLLIGNHSCVIEVMLTFMMGNFPSFVSRKENTKVMLFKNIARMSDAILVDRDAAVSRKQTMDAILQRADDPKSSQLMIFPEGTTANLNTLFLFKKGAFEAGKPVQMICITFPYKHFNPCWTGRAVGGNSIIDIVWRLCAQFVTHAELRALPVYHPTPEEQKDPFLYARHCQKMMATVLRENISDATFSDYPLAEKAYAEAHGKTWKSD